MKKGTDRRVLEKKIREMEPWFHCIDLGNGLTTKTKSYWAEPLDHPLRLWKMLEAYLPTDFTGKKVLDVGCNAGFVAIEAKKRGADYVLGIDVNPLYLEQARLVASVLDLDIDIRKVTIYELDSFLEGVDLVFCLGVIYHLKNPMLALEKLHAVTNGRLVLESAILNPLVQRVMEIFDRDGRFRPRQACFVRFVENRNDIAEDAANWWIPSAKALTAMVRSVGFQNVRIISRSSTRAVIVADKYD